MFELLTLFVFFWLLVKAAKLAFRLTWGIAKIIASVLMVIALPVLVLCLLFAGGIVLLVTLALLGLALAIVKACL